LTPVLIFDFTLARYLPPAYQADVFWKDVPLAIAGPENVLRGLVFSVPILMPIAHGRTATRTLGFALYAGGLVLYCSSWLALIAWPDSEWRWAAIGFTAPSWTPLFWLVGIALIGSDRLFAPLRCARRWMFVLLSVAFLVFHNLHSALIFARTSGG
jgi:hypothetical protein